MATIAVAITDLFEDVEYTKPAAAFRDAGHTLVHIGLKEDSTVKGKAKGTQVKIDRAISSVSSDDFDILFIPGGCSPDRLRADDRAVQFVQQFVESGKPVLAICHAPQLLITAQVLQGRRITGYKSIIQDIKNAGAEFVDEAVVEDDNLLSSRNPGDIPAFIEASLKKIEGAAPAGASGTQPTGETRA